MLMTPVNTYNYSSSERRHDETLRRSSKNVALLHSVVDGITPRVGYLLEIGADIDFEDGDGLSVIHHAVLVGFEDIVDLLLQRGANINATHHKHGTPLCIALEKERSHIVTRLLSARADVNRAAENKITPLHWATLRGDAEMMKTLIDRGANIFVVANTESFSPSHVSRSHNKHLQQSHLRFALGLAAELGNVNGVQLLCARGALEPPTDYRARLPLFYAVCNGWDDCVRLLLGNGVDSNQPALLEEAAKYPTYALLLAVEHRMWSTAQLLFEAGARRDVKTEDGMSVLHLLLCQRPMYWKLPELQSRPTFRKRNTPPLEMMDMQNVLRFLQETWLPASIASTPAVYQMHIIYRAAADESSDTLASLVDVGANVDCTDSIGSTALCLAVANAHLVAMKRLLHFHARTDVSGHCVERRPLWEAIARGNFEAVELLSQANPNIRDASGWTPLHEAASRGQEVTIKHLVKAGANLSAKDSTLRSPLHVAGDRGTFNLLIELGANPDEVDANGNVASEALVGERARSRFYLLPRRSVSHEQLLRRLSNEEKYAVTPFRPKRR